MFGGWDRGSWGVEEGTVAMNIGNNSHEEARERIILWCGMASMRTRRAHRTSLPDRVSIGPLKETRLSTQFKMGLSRSAEWERKCQHTILGSYGGIGFSQATYSNDLLRPHDILVSGNYVESRVSSSACMYPPIPGSMFNVTIVNNTFNCLRQ